MSTEQTPSLVLAVSSPEESSPPPAPQPADAAPPPAAAEPAPPQAPETPRYDAQLQALMARAREARERQVTSQAQQQELELLQRIRLAKDLGPNAVLKAVGVEPQRIDIEKLLNPKKEDDEPKSVKEIKEQVAQLNQYIASLKQQQEEERQRQQQEQQVGWERNELGQISQFIDTAKDKFEYVGAAKAIGSDKDIYNGMVSMYNQGYSPKYEEIADLVESRIEQLIDLVAPTKKFSDYIGKKFGVQLGRKGATSVTLTGGMSSETPESVDLDKMTDEENRQYALKAAYAAKQEAIRRLGLVDGK